MLRDTNEHEEDLRLVGSVARGDAQATDELLRRLRCIPVILRSRNQRMGAPLDATLLQDQVQETLTAIWTRLDNFTGASSLEAWVYRFCVNKHLSAVRNQGRRARIVAISSPALESAVAPDSETNFDEELIELAIEELKQSGAQVVRLKHYSELTFHEIAKRLSISPNTAKTHYYRALRELRSFFQRRKEDPT